MKKAYWVGIVNVKNHDEYKKYTDIAGPALIAAGAKILSRGGKIINLEGKEMNRLVVIEFSSMEHAESFYKSDEIAKEDLIDETKSLMMLGLLSESLDWLGEQVFQVANLGSVYSNQMRSPISPTTIQRINSTFPTSSPSKSQLQDRRSFLARRTQDILISNSANITNHDQKRSEFATLSIFESKRYSMAEKCQQLSDKGKQC